MSAALQIQQDPAGTVHASEARAFAVAEFRRLANELESGKLRGARIEWREGSARVVVVEVDPWCRRCDANIEHECKRAVRLITTEITGREGQE
jgi:hypothetical protein